MTHRKILITGGAGYIGSHLVKKMLAENKKIVIFDNLSRGHKESIPEGVDFENVDLRNIDRLKEAFEKYDISSVIHFAAFAYVGESVEKPALYYRNNLAGSLNLLECMHEREIDKLVFSSTCSLYGNPDKVPISEEQQVNPINPYAKTKLAVEYALNDFSVAYGIKYVALRYFNAAGADFDAQIGESHDPETHLIPLVLQVAHGKRDLVKIFGNDYNTDDGTCIRDYIHVNDLADGHIRALEYLKKDGLSTHINLGTGNGYSVLDIIKTAEKVTGKKIKFEIIERRPGDPDILVADNKKAKELLGWVPECTLEDIISSAWNWQINQKY